MYYERYRKEDKGVQILLAAMSVYAVVQFLNKTQKECAVVPLIWLTDNNSICYWPNTKSDIKFKALVKSNAVYQSSWKKFDINAVLHTEDDYDAAEQFMNNYIEQVTSSSDNSKNKKEIIKRYNLIDSKCDELENSDSNTAASTKRKKKHDPKMSIKRKRIVKSPTPSSNTEDSTEDSKDFSTSDEDLNENNNLANEKTKEIRKYTFMKKDKNNTDFLLQKRISSSLQNKLEHTTSVQSSLQQIPAAPVIKSIQSINEIVIQSPARLGRQNVEKTFSSMETDKTDQERQSITGTSNSHSITKIPRVKDFVPLSEVEFQRVVLSYLQSIEITYEQVLSKIDALRRKMNSTEMTTLTKPEGLPELPLSTMEQFEEMEKLLEVEENFNYYVSLNKYISNF